MMQTGPTDSLDNSNNIDTVNPGMWASVHELPLHLPTYEPRLCSDQTPNEPLLSYKIEIY